MKKNSSIKKVEELMKKRAEENEETKVEKDIKKPLDQVVYTVVQDQEKGGNNFFIAKILFNYETKEAKVDSLADLSQKVIGMRFPVEQENLKYYFQKNKKMGDEHG